MIEMLLSGLRLSTPLLFAGMGGVIAERSGIATICLEGVLLVSAWSAAVVNYATGSPTLALVAAVVSGIIFMLMHAFLSVTAKADQIVSGVAVNMLAAGMTPLLTKTLFGGPTSTPTIPSDQRLQSLFGHQPLIYLALLTPLLLHFALYRTRWGLRLIAAGDGAEALRTTGVSPEKVRYLALIVSGAVTSLGGAYLSIAHSSQFTRDMAAGRGYIALAAVIFGKWKPLPTFLACVFFGIADAVQIQLQSATWRGVTIPVQFIQAFPYFITLFVLVVFVGRARPPLNIGQS